MNNNPGDDVTLFIGDAQADASGGTTEIDPGTGMNYFLLKLEFGVNVDDGLGGTTAGTRGSLWFNPDLSTGQSSLGSANAVVEDDTLAIFDAIEVFHLSGDFFSQNDEIRLASDFESAFSGTSVAQVPEPSPLRIRVLSG